MGVYIKGMEMPTSCFYCPFREKVNPDDYVCMALNKEFEETFSLIVGKRHKDCPLVPVPKHGRLIDADAMIIALETQDYSCAPDTLEEWTPMDMTEAEIADIRNAPTVIPASEEGEE